VYGLGLDGLTVKILIVFVIHIKIGWTPRVNKTKVCLISGTLFTNPAFVFT
jgi:hypothetical protein